MITIDIPDFGKLELVHLVCDYNGTLAFDGAHIPGVDERLVELAAHLKIYIITADTYGRVAEDCAHLPVEITVIPPTNQGEEKGKFVHSLEGDVVALGNGRNDRLMLKAARLGVALIQGEGAAAGTIADADVVFTSVTDALDALINPVRLIATLRS